MPPPWSKPLDIDRLAGGAAEVGFEIPLAALPRLGSRTPGIGGAVRGMVRFGRHSGTPMAEISLDGTAVLQCQRCMQPMALPVHSVARVALLASAAEANGVAGDLEPVLAPEGHISVGDLVEEEMLLALPIVPLHEVGGQCPAVVSGSDGPSESAAQRPFERLGEMLSHK